MSPTDFSTLKLDPRLLENLSSLGYQAMTPIQAQSLPAILAGKDVIAQGKTGSGKTAAFGLGLLNKLDTANLSIQSLVLCPTHELADQVAKEIRKLARNIPNTKVLTLCGGIQVGPQLKSLKHGAHIVVGTPGRIEELLLKGELEFSHLQTLVLDEADRMLDMGFLPSLEGILEELPTQRQTLLLSATYPRKIRVLASEFMQSPEMIQAATFHDSNSIEQHFYQVEDEKSRMKALRLLLQQSHSQSCVVFCNTKHETHEVAEALAGYGFSVLALSGKLEQKDRTELLVQFANKSVSVLVATDVASRGLDIESIDVVINYQLAKDTEVHIHRIGRTGRAGSKGRAYTLCSAEDEPQLKQLEKFLRQAIRFGSLPPVNLLDKPTKPAPMRTLQIDGVKKYKVRPGDILGALTAGQDIDGKEVGKINLFEYCAYVAVQRDIVGLALKKLSQGKMKGRSFRVRIL
ncbi:ATP-dependent RNA helicase DbpA [Dongshaea marina]|uniref:ATP-dependent RNA helicase DbpA n=1 Tax=Dongshaea marina TaxID=2047966 RepID=UPI000D3E19AF|nr:ATP-dependent RNA helicase DbpA [Dongshaea marina]